MITDLTPLWISLKTAFVATVITFFLGIGAARWLSMLTGGKKAIMDAVFTLPLVLPPTVVGFFLLLLFSRYSTIGQVLNYFDIAIIFTWPATVIAATTVAFPLMYKTTRASFEQIDPHLVQAARTLGASEWRIFRKIILPMAWPGLVAGTILSFARALGEFGATLMLAGNIPGITQTIPVAIFFATESGHMEQAYLWVFIIIAISLLVIITLNYWDKLQRKMHHETFR